MHSEVINGDRCPIMQYVMMKKKAQYPLVKAVYGAFEKFEMWRVKTG